MLTIRGNPLNTVGFGAGNAFYATKSALPVRFLNDVSKVSLLDPLTRMDGQITAHNRRDISLLGGERLSKIVQRLFGRSADQAIATARTSHEDLRVVGNHKDGNITWSFAHSDDAQIRTTLEIEAYGEKSTPQFILGTKTEFGDGVSFIEQFTKYRRGKIFPLYVGGNIGPQMIDAALDALGLQNDVSMVRDRLAIGFLEYILAQDDGKVLLRDLPTMGEQPTLWHDHIRSYRTNSREHTIGATITHRANIIDGISWGIEMYELVENRAHAPVDPNDARLSGILTQWSRAIFARFLHDAR